MTQLIASLTVNDSVNTFLFLRDSEELPEFRVYIDPDFVTTTLVINTGHFSLRIFSQFRDLTAQGESKIKLKEDDWYSFYAVYDELIIMAQGPRSRAWSFETMINEMKKIESIDPIFETLRKMIQSYAKAYDVWAHDMGEEINLWESEYKD